MKFQDLKVNDVFIVNECVHAKKLRRVLNVIDNEGQPRVIRTIRIDENTLKDIEDSIGFWTEDTISNELGTTMIRVGHAVPGIFGTKIKFLDEK